MNTESELLQQIKNGDRSAMQELYCQNIGFAMAVGLRYLSNRDDVKDVVQDSFVKVLASIKTFEYRGEGSLKAWILRIVANEAVTFLKNNSKFTFVDEIPDEPEEKVPDVGNIPPKELTRLIGELPDGYRLVLNMYVFEQKSHKEIAETLGIKEASSASQYLRAKKLLGKKINDYLKELDK